jgi:hypothetical protein
LWTQTPALVYYSDPVILTDFEIIPIEVAQGVGVITTKVFFFQSYKTVFITQNYAKRRFWRKFWREILRSNLCVENWRSLHSKNDFIMPKCVL